MTEGRLWRTLGTAWNDFFYASFDLRWAAAIRIVFGFLVMRLAFRVVVLSIQNREREPKGPEPE